MELKLLTDLKELGDEKNQRNGSCRIWLEIGGISFPEKNWFDLLFILLPDWSLKATEILTKKLEKAVFGFVDGDYAFEFSFLQGDKYRVSFGRWDQFDEIFDEEGPHEFEVGIGEFAKTLVETNERIIDYVKKENISSEYFDAVEKWNDKLIKALIKAEE